MGQGMWMTSCPEAMGWGFWDLKKTVSWDLDLDEASWFFGPGWGRSSYELRGVHTRWLSQWVENWQCTNSQHSKKLCLSLLMSENLKLKKGNKSFIPEPEESRQVFWVFSDSYMHNECFRMFYISICICSWTIWTFYACEYIYIYIYTYNAVSSRQRLCRYCYMDAPHGRLRSGWRGGWTEITQECWEQY